MRSAGTLSSQVLKPRMVEHPVSAHLIPVQHELPTQEGFSKSLVWTCQATVHDSAPLAICHKEEEFGSFVPQSLQETGMGLHANWCQWRWMSLKEIHLLTENKPFSFQNKCILTLLHSIQHVTRMLPWSSAQVSKDFHYNGSIQKNRIQESPSHPPHTLPNLCKSFQIELEGFKVFYHCPISSSPTLPSSPTSQWRVSACPAALFPHAAAPQQQQITRQTQSYLIRKAVKFLTYTCRFAWFKHFGYMAIY